MTGYGEETKAYSPIVLKQSISFTGVVNVLIIGN